jgi:hypothetical protein
MDMQTNVIDLAGHWYSTVFRIVQGNIDIVDKTIGDSADEVALWLSDHGYPVRGWMLLERVPNTIPEGWYIKPDATDTYFRVVDPGNQLRPADSNLFRPPVPFPPQ